MAILDEVKEKMPSGLDDWDDDYINKLALDGASAARILNRAWLAKAAKTAEMVDVAESGSSRSMSTIHKNAVDMAEYWGAIADREEHKDESGGVSRSRTHRAVRV